MCPMEKIATCQIAFAPIDSRNGYNNDIKKVIEIIKSSQLEIAVGLLATTVKGNKNQIFELIKNIYNGLEHDCGFVMDIKISNVCGCST